MGREMTYKMLVRAINLETNQELAQLVSESFIVSPTLMFLSSTWFRSWLLISVHASCKIKAVQSKKPHSSCLCRRFGSISIHVAPPLLCLQGHVLLCIRVFLPLGWRS